MGKKTRLITLTNKNGKPTDVVLGFDISSPGRNIMTTWLTRFP